MGDNQFDKSNYVDLKQNRVILSFAVAATLLVALWQSVTVHANYGGNWSALYCTGSNSPQPPLVASEHIYVFPNSVGYDGQIYHYIAHDPFLRSNLKSYVDDPRLRYRRILVPLLAYALALGRFGWVDAAYASICLGSIALLVYWSCRLIIRAGLSPPLGLIVLLSPAVLITIDRMVVDGALAALTAGFVVYANRPSWKVLLILACAALTRETGFLLIFGYAANMVFRRQFRHAVTVLFSAAPALAWYAYEWARTPSQPYGVSFIPFSAILQALAHPLKYPPGTPLVSGVIAADYLALFGMILAFGIALMLFFRKPGDPFRTTAILFVALGVIVQRTDHWQNVYDFGRVYTPLLLLLAAVAVQRRNPWLLAPAALMLPRIGIQFVPQILGVVRWI